MTATEQWIFLCAAHKTPKEVSVCTELTFLSLKQYILWIYCEYVLYCKIHSAQQLITPGTRWTELPAFSTAINTSPAGQCSSLVCSNSISFHLGDGNHLKTRVQCCYIIVITVFVAIQCLFCFALFCFRSVLHFKHSQYRLTKRKIQSCTLDCKYIIVYILYVNMHTRA